MAQRQLSTVCPLPPAACRLPLASCRCLLQPPLALSPSSETRTHAKNVKCKRRKNKKKFRGICGKNRGVFYARQRGGSRGRGARQRPRVTSHSALRCISKANQTFAFLYVATIRSELRKGEGVIDCRMLYKECSSI